MTDTPDRRIEAVAKLLFTGPFVCGAPEEWEDMSDPEGRSFCLMAAEAVLRGIDEAAAKDKAAKNQAWIEAYYQRHGRPKKPLS